MKIQRKWYSMVLRSVSFGMMLLVGLGPLNAVVLTASRDTYISSASASSNFGTAETFQVSAQSTALIWHDITAGLPPGTTAGQIAKAMLQVFVNKQSPNPVGSFRVVAVQTAWQGPTFNSRPIYPLASPATHQLQGGTSKYILIDVTDIVRTWVASGGNNGLAIMAADNSINVLFDSKENTGTSQPPVLDITLLNPPAVAGKSFAICTRSRRVASASDFPTCSCGKQLSKFVTSAPLGQCVASSDLGSCSMVVLEARSDVEAVSCCVCAQ